MISESICAPQIVLTRSFFRARLWVEVTYKEVKSEHKGVEKLEEEIDELVYKLYGLDAKARGVIEEFLKKF